MAGVPQLSAAGVTNAYVNVAALCRDVSDAIGALPDLVSAFREATS